MKTNLMASFLFSPFFFLNIIGNLLLSAEFVFAADGPSQRFVQRTVTSSKKDYFDYLKKENLQTFVDGYIQISASIELKTPL